MPVPPPVECHCHERYLLCAARTAKGGAASGTPATWLHPVSPASSSKQDPFTGTSDRWITNPYALLLRNPFLNGPGHSSRRRAIYSSQGFVAQDPASRRKKGGLARGRRCQMSDAPGCHPPTGHRALLPGTSPPAGSHAHPRSHLVSGLT